MKRKQVIKKSFIQEKPNIQMRQILTSHHPTHNERVWLAGHLLWAHNDNADKVCKVIHTTNLWDDYDRKTTKAQVSSVLRAKKSPRRNSVSISTPSSCPEGRDLTSEEVDKLEKEFDWDKAQKEAFRQTEKMRQCLEKVCYLEPDCYERPCRWVK